MIEQIEGYKRRMDLEADSGAVSEAEGDPGDRGATKAAFSPISRGTRSDAGKREKLPRKRNARRRALAAANEDAPGPLGLLLADELRYIFAR